MYLQLVKMNSTQSCVILEAERYHIRVSYFPASVHYLLITSHVRSEKPAISRSSKNTKTSPAKHLAHGLQVVQVKDICDRQPSS